MDKIKDIPLLMLLDIDETVAQTLHDIIKKSPISITSLAKERSLSRTTLYKHLTILEQKELITHYKDTKKITVRDKPSLLLKIDHKIEETHSSLKKVVYGVLEDAPSIETRTDEDAINDVYEDIGVTLPRGGTYFRYTSRKEDGKKSPKYIDLKKKKEIERLVITSVEKASQKTKDANRFIKTVPESFSFEDNISFIIYDNKIVHIDHSTGATVSITSKRLARFQEKIFKLLWKRL